VNRWDLEVKAWNAGQRPREASAKKAVASSAKVPAEYFLEATRNGEKRSVTVKATPIGGSATQPGFITVIWDEKGRPVQIECELEVQLAGGSAMVPAEVEGFMWWMLTQQDPWTPEPEQ